VSADGNRFESAAGRWLGVVGRLRDVVRQELVTAQLVELLGTPAAGASLRILDIGCGQGTQAIALARLGHDVTGLDPSRQLLDALDAALAVEPADVRGRVHPVEGPGEDAPGLVGGGFDAVLCHGVLMYVDDDGPLLSAASEVCRDGGLLSLLVRNGDALAMRPALLGAWTDANAAFASSGYLNRLGLAARAHRRSDLDAAAAAAGWTPERWYGVRVFTDHLDEPVRSPAEMAAILDAERSAGRTDPYRGVAALLHRAYSRQPRSQVAP
jgi:S-adenosylmethionine-dependent methyltransferase